MFACLLVCLFACLLVCMHACLLVCLLACLLVCLFAVQESRVRGDPVANAIAKLKLKNNAIVLKLTCVLFKLLFLLLF